MRLSHIHEGDKSQADPLEIRIVVENDIPEEEPESDNPLDNIRDTYAKNPLRTTASISVEIWHNTKGKLMTYTGRFDELGRGPFSRYDYEMFQTEFWWLPAYQNAVSHHLIRHDRRQLPFLYVAHEAWYTMYYADKDVYQWLCRPRRSEFTLTWGHFMDIAEQLLHSNKLPTIGPKKLQHLLDLTDTGLLWDPNPALELRGRQLEK